MTFLHWSLLGGMFMVGFPIVIHLLSRGKPQPVVFPALRFVRQTAIHAERGWRVKHWLLLGLRILLIAALAIAFAAPRVHQAMLFSYLGAGTLGLLAVLATAAALIAFGSRRSATTLLVSALVALLLWLASVGWLTQAIVFGKNLLPTHGSGPITAAIVVDTSPTMDYRLGNQTRIDLAKDMGRFVIERMPLESEIAIIATDQEFQQRQDRMSAARQLDRVVAEGKSAQLAQRIRTAVELVRRGKSERREVYVLTDLCSPAWRDASRADLATLMDEGDSVLLQIIDVGVQNPNNWSLTQLQLSQEVALPGIPIQIAAKVLASKDAPKEQVNVELWMEGTQLPSQQNGQTVKPETKQIDRRTVEVSDGGAARVEFLVRDLGPGIHHAYLRLRHPDPLAIDNELSVTMDIRSEGKVLVVADDDRLGHTLCNMLSPETGSDEKTERLCEQINQLQLDRTNLADYRCLILANPSKNIGPATVAQLEKYVQSGGSLLMLLGPKMLGPQSTIMASSLDTLLPGKLARVTRARDDSLFWRPKLLSHPIFHQLDQIANSAPWSEFPIFRHLDLEELKPDTETIVAYTESGKPAIIEELRGSGRIITWTTPYPESESEPWEGSEVDVRRTRSSPDRPWNELYSGTYPWPAFAVLRGTVQYLSGWGKTRLNYTVGQTILLENDPAMYPEVYQLFGPNNDVSPLKSDGSSLVYPYARSVGTYRLLGASPNGPVVRGFSLNVASDDLQLERISQDQLNSILGETKFSVAKDRASITSSVGQARFGRELYPYLLLLVALLFIADQAMSRKFYQLRISPTAMVRTAP